MLWHDNSSHLLKFVKLTAVYDNVSCRNGRKLANLKAIIGRTSEAIAGKSLTDCSRVPDNGQISTLAEAGSGSQFCGNPERLSNGRQFSFGQLSVETLWSLTGILAAERSLLGVNYSVESANEFEERNAQMDRKILEALEEEPEPMREEQQRSVGAAVFYDSEPPPAVPVEDASASSSSASAGFSAPRTASSYLMTTNNNLDLVSCLHFLLDLYSHWLRNGCDAVALPLLSATVESVR